MNITFNGREVTNPIARAFVCFFGVVIVSICFLFLGAILLLFGTLVFFIMAAVLAIIVFVALAYPFVWIHRKWRRWIWKRFKRRN